MPSPVRNEPIHRANYLYYLLANDGRISLYSPHQVLINQVESDFACKWFATVYIGPHQSDVDGTR